MSKELSYTYLRTEEDAKYRLFLKIDPNILDKEIDIQINENNQLILYVKAGDTFITKKLTDEIVKVLENENVFTFFVDEDANILATHTLNLGKKTKGLNKNAKP